MPTNLLQYSAKVDYRISNANHLSGRYAYYDHQRRLNGIIPDLVISVRDDVYKPKNFVISDTHTFSPTLLNEFRGGITRLAFTFVPASFWSDTIKGADAIDGGWPAKIGLPANVPSFEFPRFTVAGIAALQPQTTGILNPWTWSISDFLTVIRGAHTLKFGGEMQVHQANNYQFTEPSGRFNFTAALTGDPQRPGGTGYGFASLLVGSVANAGIGTYAGQTMVVSTF